MSLVYCDMAAHCRRVKVVWCESCTAAWLGGALGSLSPAQAEQLRHVEKHNTTIFTMHGE